MHTRAIALKKIDQLKQKKKMKTSLHTYKEFSYTKTHLETDASSSVSCHEWCQRPRTYNVL